MSLDPYSVDVSDIFPGSSTPTAPSPGVRSQTDRMGTDDTPDAGSTQVDEAAQAPVGEAEGADGSESVETAETAPEAAQAPETTKPEPPAKPKNDIAAVNNQLRALARKQKQMEQLEAKQAERERANAAREARLSQLEQLDKLSDIELLKVVSEYKGTTLNDTLRRAISIVAGNPPEDKPAEPEEGKVDAKLMARLEKIEAMAQKAEALEAWKAEREAAEAAREDEAYIEGFVGMGLGQVSEDSYPYLANEEPNVIREMYLDNANRYAAEMGVPPDPKELLDYMEAEQERVALARYEKYERLRKLRNGATTQPVAQATPPVTPGVGSETQSKLARPTGITNKMSGGESGPAHTVKADDWRARVDDAAKYLESLKRK